MRFAFTDDQLAFRDAVRDLLAKECPPSVVRSAWDNDDGRSGAAWRALAEMGVLGALAPEAAGGLGLSILDVILIVEEAGYAALPEPLVEHALVAVPVLDDPARAATGEITVTASLGDPYVLYAASADTIVVDDDDLLAVVERADAMLAPASGVDGSRRLAWVEWDPVTPRGDEAARHAAFDRGALGTAAQLVGLARRMLDLTVEYTKERTQF
jgi:alkylation response protein AidB-like acyl-CoA dehydrogenase